MKSTAVLKLAASALVVGTTLIGANPMSKQIGIATASESVDPASIAATAAAEALKERDAVTAVAQAELAVAASPREAAYRALLGQAYLQSGRLVSAETAFGDALALQPNNGRASLSLALVQIALGKSGLALETLRGAGGTIPEADHGLALALAGETVAAIDMLEPAARVENASGKTRQNLALAYALAGKWTEARAIAAQDVSPDLLDQRMASWARFTQPENSWDQIASLLGVTPIEDAGQPQRLALGPIPVTGQALAAAEVAPEAEAAPVDIAVAVSDAAGTQRQIVFGPRQEIVQAIPTAVARADTKPSARVRTARFAKPVEGGKYVVQLGAYSSAGRAEAAWNNAVGRFGALGSYQPTGGSFTVRGASLYRVAAAGFDTRRDAEQVCAGIKARGGNCFVRASSGEAPAQWVQRATDRLASR